MKFGELIDELLRDVAPLKRPGTTELYFIYLGELKIELGARDIETFSRKDYMAWMREFKLRKERKTFFDYTKFLNIAFRYAYQEKYISHWIKFPSVDGESGPRWRKYTQDEIREIAHVTTGDLEVQFILAYECFMRLREVLYLQWDRVDFENESINLRKQDVKTGTRNGKGRSIPLSPQALAALKCLHRRANSTYLFPSPTVPNKPIHDNKSAWKAAKARAKIVGPARWHDIRHTALSYAVMVLKVPLAHLSKVAGVSIKTLERVYLHSDIDDVRGVTQKMSVHKDSA